MVECICVTVVLQCCRWRLFSVSTKIVAVQWTPCTLLLHTPSAASVCSDETVHPTSNWKDEPFQLNRKKLHYACEATVCHVLKKNKTDCAVWDGA